jgi:hypothetical protein
LGRTSRVVRVTGRALIEASIVTNAALAAYSIWYRRSDRIECRIRCLPPRKPTGMDTAGEWIAAGLMELGDALVRSDRIVSLIQT